MPEPPYRALRIFLRVFSLLAEFCALDRVKSRRSTRRTRRLVFPSLPPFRSRNRSLPRVRARQSQPIFDPICILGEQRNHKVERFDLSPHALNLRLLLLQNLVQVLHGWLASLDSAPWHAVDFSRRKKTLQAAVTKRLTVSAHC
jgi:hypothetical protein